MKSKKHEQLRIIGNDFEKLLATAAENLANSDVKEAQTVGSLLKESAVVEIHNWMKRKQSQGTHPVDVCIAVLCMTTNLIGNTVNEAIPNKDLAESDRFTDQMTRSFAERFYILLKDYFDGSKEIRREESGGRHENKTLQ